MFLKVLGKYPVDIMPAPYPPDVAKSITSVVVGVTGHLELMISHWIPFSMYLTCGA